ncbi:MAG: hypothetical protein AABP62_05230 [Planctomycetota bacterium]
MRKVRFAELSESVRTFLDQVNRGEGLLVEDERGCARYGVIPYEEATMSEQEAAWQRIERLQKKAGLAMHVQGATESDVDQLLQEK